MHETDAFGQPHHPVVPLTINDLVYQEGSVVCIGIFLRIVLFPFKLICQQHEKGLLANTNIGSKTGGEIINEGHPVALDLPMSFTVSFGGYLHVGDDPVHHGIAEGISLEHVSKDFEVSQHDPDVIFGFDSIEVPNKELQQVVLLQIELNPVES